MPHALIGYAGSTLRAAEMFRETFPDEALTVLVDYFGRETSDAVAVCRRFPELAGAGRLAFRMDTPGVALLRGVSIWQSRTRSSKTTRRKQSAATAPRRNCAT